MEKNEIVIGIRVTSNSKGIASSWKLRSDRKMEKGEYGVITGFDRNVVEIKLDRDGKYCTRVCAFLNIALDIK